VDYIRLLLLTYDLYMRNITHYMSLGLTCQPQYDCDRSLDYQEEEVECIVFLVPYLIA